MEPVPQQVFLAALESEVVEAPGASVSFSIKQILVELEGGHYVGPTLPGPLAYLLVGRWATGVAAAVVDGAGVLVTVAAATETAAVNPILGWELIGGAQGYGCGMIHTCLPCPFVMGRTC